MSDADIHDSKALLSSSLTTSLTPNGMFEAIREPERPNSVLTIKLTEAPNIGDAFE